MTIRLPERATSLSGSSFRTSGLRHVNKLEDNGGTQDSPSFLEEGCQTVNTHVIDFRPIQLTADFSSSSP